MNIEIKSKLHYAKKGLQFRGLGKRYRSRNSLAMPAMEPNGHSVVLTHTNESKALARVILYFSCEMRSLQRFERGARTSGRSLSASDF